MTRWFLLPFVGHFALVVVLYWALTILRVRAVVAGGDVSDYVRADADTGAAHRVGRNLANQFEAPLFAYVAMLVVLYAQAVSSWDVAAAWIFLAGRLIHSAVQTLTTNVPLRGAVFMINFLGIVMLVGHVAMLIWTGAVK